MQFIPVKNYDFNLKLSEHFTLGEFIRSDKAFGQKIIMQYVHQDHIVENIKFLVTHFLEPARLSVGEPIYITSGFRCSGTNMAVGGSKTSLHLYGLAADIRISTRANLLIEFLRECKYHELYVYNNYIHFSVKHVWAEQKYKDLRR